MRIRIAVADFVTNTCFPLLAAEELGFFKGEGLDAQVELITPATKAISALREGATEAYAGGSVHSVLKPFPYWKGVKLIAALSQGIPWLLVVRADLRAERGDMNALKGLRIGATHGPDAALKQLLIAAGLDAERDKVKIVTVPGDGEPGVSFGVVAAKALEAGQIDAFWANAMATEIANTAWRRKSFTRCATRRGSGCRSEFHLQWPRDHRRLNRSRPGTNRGHCAGYCQDPQGTSGGSNASR